MPTKRNLSSCSEPDCDLKRVNLQQTPNKIMPGSEMDDLATFQQNNARREEAIKELKENAPTWFSAVFDFIMKDFANISTQVNQVHENNHEIHHLKQKVTELEAKNQALETHVTKLEDYSRKPNLFIKGLPESGPKENVFELVSEFLCNSLQVPNGDKIGISNAHRLGKPPHLNPSSVKKSRDIIVRFEKVTDRELVWRHRFQLKGSPIMLFKDFCPATQEKRKQLQPYFHAARKHPQVSRCYLDRDALVVNGSKYNVETIQSLPFGLSETNQPQKLLKDIPGVAFYGRESFLSNFHPSPIVDGGLTFQTVEHLYQYKKASYFNDTQTAKAILTANTPRQAKGLGYKIKDYDDALWSPVAVQNMHGACVLKFQ